MILIAMHVLKMQNVQQMARFWIFYQDIGALITFLLLFLNVLFQKLVLEMNAMKAMKALCVIPAKQIILNHLILAAQNVNRQQSLIY